MQMDHLTLSVDDGIATIELNRPERRNALSLDVLAEFGATIDALDGRADVQVVVVAGNGPVFSAGHDLSEMLDRDPAFYGQLFGACTEAMTGVQRIPQPVIARVHGMATAAGCQLVAACDLAIASDDCRFATPGVKIGLFCSTPMVPITRAIGRKRALQMLLTGTPIEAATAVEWGLINQAVPHEDLETAVLDLASQIKQHSREVVAIGKAAFYRQVSETDTEAYRLTESIMSANAAHPDAQEGMTAFLEKRKPNWPSQR